MRLRRSRAVNARSSRSGISCNGSESSGGSGRCRAAAQAKARQQMPTSAARTAAAAAHPTPTTALALALLVAVACAVAHTAAADVYVAPNGSDGNACTTPDSPCGSVSGAVERAQPDDTVRFAAGVYTNQCAPNVTVVRKALSFVGGSGLDAAAVVIDCGGRGGFLKIVDSSVFVAGMTIRRADSLQAGAIYIGLSVSGPIPRPYNHTFRSVRFEANIGRSDHLTGMGAGAVAIVYNILGSVRNSVHDFDGCEFDGNVVTNGMPNSVATLVSAAGAVLIHIKVAGGQLGGSVIAGVTHRFAHSQFRGNTMPYIPSGGMLTAGSHGVTIVHDANGENGHNDVLLHDCQHTDVLGDGFVGSGSPSAALNLVVSGALTVAHTSHTGPNTFLRVLVEQSTFTNVSSLSAIMTGGVAIAPVTVGLFAFRNNQHSVVSVSDSTFYNCPGVFGALANGGPGIVSGALATWYATAINDNFNLTTAIVRSTFSELSGGDGGVSCIPSTTNAQQSPCVAVAGGAVAIYYGAQSAINSVTHQFLDSAFFIVAGGSHLQAAPFMVGGGAIAIMQLAQEHQTATTVMTGCNASYVTGASYLSGQAGNSYIMSASAFLALLVGGQGAYAQSVSVTNTVVDGAFGAYQLQGMPLAATAAGAISVLMSAGTNTGHSVSVHNCQMAYGGSYQQSGFALSTGTDFAGAGVLAVLFVEQIVPFGQSIVSQMSQTSNIAVRLTDSQFEANAGPNTATPLYQFALGGVVAVQYSMADQPRGSTPTFGTNTGNSLYVDNCQFYNNSAGSYSASALQPAAAAGAIAVLYTATGGSSGCTHTFRATTFDFNVNANPLSAAGAVMVYIDSDLSNGNTVDFTDTHFVGNGGSLGGAVSVQSQAIWSTTVSVTKSEFNGNGALCQSTICCCSGGALAINGAQFSVQNSSFVRNHATYSGGALWTAADATGIVMYSQFESNGAGSFGDEIHSRSSGGIVLRDCAMDFNGTNVPGDNTVAIAALKPLLTVENNTRLMCPVGNSVYLSRNFYGCQFCPSKSYLVLPGNWLDPPSGASTPCKPCPYGADCDGGASVRTVAGYWAVLGADGNLSTTACPDGYCCLGQSSCNWQEACTSTNRDGVLCGSCMAGYSETIGSTRCRPTHSCNDALWFFPLFFIAATVLFAYFFLSSPKSSGLAAVVGFFYQCVGMLFAQSAAADVFGDTLTSLFDFRVETGSGTGICAFPGLTALGKQFVWLFTPLSLLVPLCCVLLYYVLVDRFCASVVETETAPLGPFDSLASSYVGSGGARSGGDSLFNSVRSTVPVPPSSSALGPSVLLAGSVGAGSPAVVGAGAMSMQTLHSPGTAASSSAVGARMSPLTIPGAGTSGAGGSGNSVAGSVGTVNGTASPSAIPASASTPLPGSFRLDGAAATSSAAGAMTNPLLVSGTSSSSAAGVSVSGGTSGDVKADGKFDSKTEAAGLFGSGGSSSGGGTASSKSRWGTASGDGSGSADGTVERQPLHGRGHHHHHHSHHHSQLSFGGGTITLTKVQHLKSRGPHFAAALTNIGIYTYSSVVKAVFVLLHCVPINGLDGLYLFESAVTRCYQGWQFALIVVLVVLAAIPVAILWYALSVNRNLHPTNPARRAMFDVLFSPYAMHAVPWNAVLLLQRFVLIVFDTFLVVANTRVQVLTSICVVYLLLHVMVQPFHRASMNRFQLLCLALLVLIGLSNAPAASLLTSGYPSNSTTNNAFTILSAVQSAFLALPFGIAFVIWVRTKLREYYRKQKAIALAADKAKRHGNAGTGTGTGSGSSGAQRQSKPNSGSWSSLALGLGAGGGGNSSRLGINSSAAAPITSGVSSTAAGTTAKQPGTIALRSSSRATGGASAVVVTGSAATDGMRVPLLNSV